jgi:hypothetical protein
MRKLSIVLAIAVFLSCPLAGESKAGVSFGLSADEEGLKGFYLAIGDHYKVPEKQIVAVRKHNIPDEEMSVVFFLARQTEVSPDLIVKLRLGGSSWIDICTRHHLSPEIFYVPLKTDPGPPYGKAWGHYKNRKKTDWSKVRLTDAEVVNFVNLKFISGHYGYSPDEVVKMRSGGKDFVAIHGQVKKAKGQSKKEPVKHASKGEPKGKKKKKR